MPFVHHGSLIVFAVVTLATGACRAERAGTRTADSTGVSDARDPASVAPAFRDDFGDTLSFGTPPRRIASLNPATTELFFALGAGDRLVGRTHFDLYPPEAQRVRDLGNGMQPNVESVLGVRPDLVVLYASDANRDAAARFHAAGVPTLTLHSDRIADFRRTVETFGRLLADTVAAHALIDSVDRTLARVRAATMAARRPTVFWKAWDSPVIAIGGGSFLTELVDIAGGRNIYADDPRSALDVTIEDVVRRDPDVVLSGPESAARMRATPAWRALRAMRENRVLIVDTTLVGRPGVRLGEAAVFLARLLHPGSLP
jgi:ABC-type Fe3+-hydroxamate transport system substrate-binding protein